MLSYSKARDDQRCMGLFQSFSLTDVSVLGLSGAGARHLGQRVGPFRLGLKPVDGICGWGQRR